MLIADLRNRQWLRPKQRNLTPKRRDLFAESFDLVFHLSSSKGVKRAGLGSSGALVVFAVVEPAKPTDHKRLAVIVVVRFGGLSADLTTQRVKVTVANCVPCQPVS